jgi:meso-butanediol dehydrogenase/(S,S)-butanediol dehydrogenase/diacetyl reductase
VKTAPSHFKGIDAVHNNAGIASPSKTLDETSEEEWDGLMTVNVKSIYWTTKAALPILKQRRGFILNTATALWG